MHAGVWSSAAAQLPLSLPHSHREAERKYESMGSTWGRKLWMQLGAGRTQHQHQRQRQQLLQQVGRGATGAFLQTVHILTDNARDDLNISFDIIYSESGLIFHKYVERKTKTCNCGYSDNKYLRALRHILNTISASLSP